MFVIIAALSLGRSQTQRTACYSNNWFFASFNGINSLLLVTSAIFQVKAF